MEKTNIKKEYNLFTAISMIIGIVIGSGIFFKSDDVLNFTGGNVMLGVIVFIIAGISIIFGSLSVAQIALRTNKVGGVITYMEEVWSTAVGGAFGWFHTAVYYPTLIVIVSWVAGIYTCMLFGINQTLEMQCLIGISSVIVFFILNIIAKKLGGYFQISSTIIKLIPLFLIAFLGIFAGDTSNITTQSIVSETSSMGFIAAIVPIAFSFDGWIIATSLSHEIKNGKKALPLALIISPIFIVLIYGLYLMGISALVGPQEVIALGDGHVDVAANLLFGASGAKLILVFIIVSVLGTVNGLIMGAIRLPYSLAKRNLFIHSKQVSKMNEKLDIPLYSAGYAFLISMIWYFVHFFVMKYSLLLGSDISEIAIVMNYVCYIGLYVAVIKLYRRKEIKGIFNGLINPIIATIGSLIIFFGSAFVSTAGFGVNYKAIAFMLVSVVILVAAYWYCKQKVNQ